MENLKGRIIFAWSYSDLKEYDKNIMEHKIPLKSESKPVAHKIRHLNPMLLPIIEKEIRKMWEANIILPLRFSNWVANIVPIRKKNRKIIICIDFRNLNRYSLKDNYPLPKMDHILQKFVGSKRLPMIDGFSRYNQILVDKQDREKTTFTTPWRTFMYNKVLFGLMNAGAKFQRAMDIAFTGENDKFVVIYLDDITFSKFDQDHLKHLQQVFDKCRKFGLSLNPKKSCFVVQEGKMLGHIVTENGICIDPGRVEAI